MTSMFKKKEGKSWKIQWMFLDVKEIIKGCKIDERKNMQKCLHNMDKRSMFFYSEGKVKCL